MDISTFSLEKLKAFAYDQICILKNTENNLRLLQIEIDKKSVEKLNENPDK